MRTRLGQNFLVDKNIAKNIVASANISSSDIIVEIGPGRGILTSEIKNLSKKIIAVEIDKNLANYLYEKYKKDKSIEIVNADFLKWLPPNKKNLKFIANLPYYIAPAIIEKILHLNNWDTAIFMVQKEVANRLKSPPCSSDYGILSIACQVFCKVEKLFDVPNTCFFPKPMVTSTVIKLNRYKKPLIKKSDEKRFFKIVKSSFLHRRKTILNSLFIELNIEKEKLQKLLEDTCISPLTRAEMISIDGFIKLTKTFNKNEVSV